VQMPCKRSKIDPAAHPLQYFNQAHPGVHVQVDLLNEGGHPPTFVARRPWTSASSPA